MYITTWLGYTGVFKRNQWKNNDYFIFYKLNFKRATKYSHKYVKGRKKKKPVVPGLFYSQYIAIKNNNLKDFEKYCPPMKHVFSDF
jgi:hypothetical protein